MSQCLLGKGTERSYFEYSTSTGVVGISRKTGIGRSFGAEASLVQQPQEDESTAVALTQMARSKRIMVEFV